MRQWIAVLVAVGLLGLAVPTASAHNCNSGQAGECGPCTEGETHNHNDPEHSCQSGSFLPGFTGGLLVAALGIALAIGVRRRA